ncbi:hypothetical protein [Halococcus sp. PRR34]|uniref:hypothetical protein n=1 Tax=Halococcus sp. PRR34 TaxID=3020830 RepID=UPI00235E18C0|nr:hypothetical protein [Halococcus sp. PRR34]
MSETVEMSRRTFMTGAAAVALSASAGAQTASAGPSRELLGEDQTVGSRFDRHGSPSRAAERTWAEAEYTHYQQRMGDGPAQQAGAGGNTSGGSGSGSPTSPSFDRVLDAVKDVGCDPSGGRPIHKDIDGSAMQDGTLIVFPPGKYLLSGQFQASVDGTFGMVGAGYKQASSPPKPGKNAAMFVAAGGSRTRINFRTTTGLFANFVMDQRSSKSSTGIVIGSSGFVQGRDIRFIGVQDNTGEGVSDSLQIPPCSLQSDEGATVRAERVVGRYIGLPGDKNSGGAPMFWVGSGNSGTAQIGHCISQGAADNGVYGGRTPGNVQIKGGQWVNNEVSQLRFSGTGSWADGVTLVIDKDRYKGPTSGGGFNEVFSTNGVKIERGDNGYAKAGGAVLRNADIRVGSVGSKGIGAPVLVRGSGGALKIENCRIVNNLDQPSVRAEGPGTGYSGHASPPPHNVTIAHSVFSGAQTDTIVQVSGRENSLIRETCFKVPGSSPESVSGMKIGSGVGFGKQCTAGGLKAPQKVGSSGNLSSLPAPSYNSTAGTVGAGGRSEQGLLKKIIGVAVGGFFLILFLFLGTIALIVVGVLAVFGALTALLGGD